MVFYPGDMRIFGMGFLRWERMTVFLGFSLLQVWKGQLPSVCSRSDGYRTMGRSSACGWDYAEAFMSYQRPGTEDHLNYSDTSGVEGHIAASRSGLSNSSVSGEPVLPTGRFLEAIRSNPFYGWRTLGHGWHGS